ncbi:MAG: PEP-CTERM sorting domain-containing protein [Phycisphaerae bacterium]
MKRTRQNILVCVALVGLLGLTTAAQGDIIVQYGFGSGVSPDAGSVAADVVAGDVTGDFEGSISGRGDTSGDPYSDGNTKSIFWQGTSDGSAAFTLDADDPLFINYSRIVFKIDHETEVVDDEWFVQSSATSGDIATGGITTNVDGNGTWTLADVDLSGITELQGQDQVTFTVGFRGVSTGPTTSTTRIDKIQVEGTVVPEPATMALLGLGGLGMLIRRKRA